MMTEMRLENKDRALLALRERKQLLDQAISSLEKYFKTREKKMAAVETKK